MMSYTLLSGVKFCKPRIVIDVFFTWLSGCCSLVYNLVDTCVEELAFVFCFSKANPSLLQKCSILFNKINDRKIFHEKTLSYSADSSTTIKRPFFARAISMLPGCKTQSTIM